MTTKLYLIRHCEAMGNVQRLFQGTTDLDISENGEKQLEYLKARFANIEIDAVYSSPLMRAVKTAHSVADQKGLEVITRKGLCELDGGVVEGKPFAESFQKYPHLADEWDNHPQDFHPQDGESMRHAYDRIWEAVLEIVKENKGKKIAAATHGGISRCLLCRLIYGNIDRLKDVSWCENTAVSLIEFDSELNPTLVFMNDHSHVPDELMPKRNRLSAFAGVKQ